MASSNTKRIVLLGKSGAGKSLLVKNIFGQEAFTVGHSLNVETKTCQSKTGSVNGRQITLIDTPGFFDTDRSEEERKPEIVRCITECSPGPHAFLFVLKVEKYTEHEKAVVSKICKYFSQEVFKYATVLFTHGDQLPEGQTIQDFVSQNEFMSDLVKKCGGRCHVFDNKYWNKPSEDEYRSNRFQVEELLKTIVKTVEENQGGCYTNEMLQAVEENIRQEEKRIRERSGNMSEEEIRKQAKDSFFNTFMIRATGITVGALMGVFAGMVELARVVAKLGQQGGAAAGGAVGAAAKVGGVLSEVPIIVTVLGAVVGGWIGYKAAESATTPGEAAKKTIKDIKDMAACVRDCFDLEKKTKLT